MDKQDYDNSKAEEFASKMFQFLNSGMLSLMISIGYKTGLFDIIAQLKPSTSQEISQAAKLNERYIREWLGAMVTGNIIEYDPLTKKYFLPKEHSAFLTRKSGIDNLAVLAQYVSLMGNVEDKIVECFRNGGGLPYSEYPKFQQLQAEETARIFDSKLINQILPLIPEINNGLNDGIKVLDIGCGRGRAVNLMGKAFSRSKFTGCDISHEGILSAKEEAKNMGLTNVQFEIKDALLVEELGKFDLITAFDTIHDQAQPTKVLKAINASLNNDGFFLMQDIAASSKVEKNIDSILAPTLYTISTMHCMSVSLAFDGEGLGTMWGKELAVNKLTEAGFKNIKVKNVEGDIMNYYYVSRK
ncbi:MAG TPA: class I SAM-dependent methyltransferase [Nitrososphaeraceae archaeon]|nr:class I SAM-dependent methyltransferase [Nitrososphaeraceae archaeon]